MAKIFPSKQVSVDAGNGTTIVVSKVKLVTATDDYITLPEFVDAVSLNPQASTADPTFYLASSDRSVGWANGVVGTEHTVVSKHTGIVNFAPGGATADAPK